MARKLIHHTLDDRGRLRCDNARCRYVLSAALPWGPNLIVFQCPKCGSNMLTRKDYEDSEKMVRIINWLNRWFGWLGTKEPKGTAWSLTNHDGKVTRTNTPST